MLYLVFTGYILEFMHHVVDKMMYTSALIDLIRQLHNKSKYADKDERLEWVEATIRKNIDAIQAVGAFCSHCHDTTILTMFI